MTRCRIPSLEKESEGARCLLLRQRFLFGKDRSGCLFEDDALGGEEFADALFGVVEHVVELGAGVGVVFGGGLGFDEAAVGEHDDIHVDGGAGVFFVAEVEENVAVDDADTGGGDHLFEG
jgi:hypothetical protein